MFVRLERIQKSQEIIIVDEIDRVIGTVKEVDFFFNCVDTEKEPLEEDDYLFYCVDYNCLKTILL